MMIMPMAGCPEEEQAEAVDPGASLPGCWSRQVTDMTDFSESADWSRTCTEDVCPVYPSTAECARGPDLLPPRRVNLRLAAGGEGPTWASAASVADLRRTVSEATGLEPGRVQLCEGVARRALLDHELVPLQVEVVGVDRLPGGGVVLGRAQFLRVLLDIKRALSATPEEEPGQPSSAHADREEKPGQPEKPGPPGKPAAAGAQEKAAPSSGAGAGAEAARPATEELAASVTRDIFRRLRQEAEDRAQVFFQDFAEMDKFYCTSAFSGDPEFRTVYTEISVLLSKFGAVPCELLGGGGGLIGA